ncbi:zinc ribbon domain-containing protein [Vibrio sp. SS-MA-C1-2]|uniref:double zinc ribbon domain-containing protein n=1 Tax=Vibrio sp. SS-MA-C1-2 TaxID=2908646 RepID=UPI001F325B95|nr:zinc ribbon domain-containing protein [Vibrio sp. SS-MA-C1-2]UJF17219.1 zinc ribbon domain-containing protein [Vibrio sp. SS-MA-C1-2]
MKTEFFCKECQGRLSDDDLFCSSCGAEIYDELDCAECSASFCVGEERCPQCGTPLNKEEQAKSWKRTSA